MDDICNECPHTIPKSRKRRELDFIKALEMHPELWDRSNAYYTNKFVRKRGLSKLMLILRKIKPFATYEDVKRKINSLISKHRRELSKVRASFKTENLYIPKAWNFSHMSFLWELDTPNTAYEPMEEDESDSGSESEEISMSPTGSDDSSDEILLPNRITGRGAPTIQSSQLNFGSFWQSRNMAKLSNENWDPTEQEMRQFDALQEANHLRTTARKNARSTKKATKATCTITGKVEEINDLHTTDKTNATDRNCNVQEKQNVPNYSEENYLPYSDHNYSRKPFMSEWLCTLDHVRPMQKFYALQAISLILYEAQLGRLKENSVQINTFFNVQFEMN